MKTIAIITAMMLTFPVMAQVYDIRQDTFTELTITMPCIREAKYDTIPVVLIVIDRSNDSTSGNLQWIRGYEVTKTAPQRPTEHHLWLDDNKKRLNPRMTVWMAAIFNNYQNQ